MQWSDVTTPPKDRVLRQFALLWLLFFVGLAAWRTYSLGLDTRAQMLGGLGVTLGTIGLWRPRAMRYIFTAWMIVAFPIGWTVSKVALAAIFFLVLTPVAVIFKLTGRDALVLRRRGQSSYWTAKRSATKSDEYLHQF